MPGLDTSAASNVLKTFYLPPVQEMLNNSTVLLSRIEKEDKVPVQGNTFTVPLHTGRNTSAGVGIAEGGTLPTAGNQGYEKAVVPNKFIYGRVQVSGVVIAATRSDVGSFVRAIDSEIKGVTRDIKRDVNRQLNGNGQDALAYWTSADNTSGTVVDDGNGFAFTHLPNSGTLTCDLIDASDHTTELGSDIVVTLGAEDTTTPGFNITWTGTVSGSADGDYLVRANTLGKQLMGIEGIISDIDPVGLSGGLHGLPVATKTFWKSQTVGDDASKVDLTFALMQKVLSKIATNSDYEEKDVKLLLCSYQMRDKYVELCVNERKFYNTMEIDGGFEAVEYNGKPLVPDPQAKHGRIYFITPESLKLFRMQDFDWMDRDGSVFSRVANVDAYEATIFHYGDLGCVARNANGLLRGINE